jgi:hypothetical protein
LFQDTFGIRYGEDRADGACEAGTWGPPTGRGRANIAGITRRGDLGHAHRDSVEKTVLTVMAHQSVPPSRDPRIWEEATV